MKTLMMFLFFIAALAVLLFFGCDAGDSATGDDSDTDFQQDDSSPDLDDDVAGDDTQDDDVSNDDTSGDDDSADDDTTDDTADDDTTGPVSLLLMGQDDAGYASWKQTDAGWLREAIPEPDGGYYTPDLGPSFFLNGEKGWLIWNLTGDMTTGGHVWLVYDPSTGWDYDTEHYGLDGNANVSAIFATGPQSMWALTWLYQIYTISTDVYHLSDASVGWTLETQQAGYYTSMNFPDENTGLVSGQGGGGLFVEKYDHGVWAPTTMPVRYALGMLVSISLTDTENGLGAWMTQIDNSQLLALENGVWSDVPIPAGCDGSTPTFVASGHGRAIALSRFETDNRFWELRNGAWTCRNVGGRPRDVDLWHVQVFSGGRAYIMGNSSGPKVWEVTASALNPVAVPAEINSIWGAHLLGPGAPPHSYLPPPGGF